jgi:hypothetical protein
MSDQKLDEIATSVARWWVGETTKSAVARAPGVFNRAQEAFLDEIGPGPLGFSTASLLYASLQPKVLDIANLFVDAAVPLAERGELGTHPLQFELKTDYEPLGVRLPGAALMSRLERDRSAKWREGVSDPLYEAAAEAGADARFVWPMKTSMIVDIVSGVINVRGENISERISNSSLLRSKELQETATEAINSLNEATGKGTRAEEALVNFTAAVDKLTAHFMEHPVVRRAAERRMEQGKMKRPEPNQQTHLMTSLARLNALGFVVGLSHSHAAAQDLHAQSTNSGLKNFDEIPTLSRDASRELSRIWSGTARDINHHFGHLSGMRVPTSGRNANPITYTAFDL